MDTYLLVKYLHLLAVVSAFAGAALIHLNLIRVKKAERIPQALDSLSISAWYAPRMTIVVVALLLTGGYMAQTRWTWQMPWIQVAVVALLSLPVVGVAILKPRMEKIGRLLGQAGDGPMTDELRAPLRDPLFWIASHYPPVMAAAIMFLMVNKFGYTGSLIVMAVAVVLAAGSAVPMMKAAKR